MEKSFTVDDVGTGLSDPWYPFYVKVRSNIGEKEQWSIGMKSVFSGS